MRKRHSRVENLGPVELAERSIDVGKIGQRPDQPKILRPEGTLVKWERLLVEHFSFLVVTAVRRLLGPKPELETAPKIIDTILLSNFAVRARVAYGPAGRRRGESEGGRCEPEKRSQQDDQTRDAVASGKTGVLVDVQCHHGGAPPCLLGRGSGPSGFRLHMYMHS
jgi:hypothetical protein